jgi:hypothetical protein
MRHQVSVEVNGFRYNATVTNADYVAILAILFYTKEEAEGMTSLGSEVADVKLRQRFAEIEAIERHNNPDISQEKLNELVVRRVGEATILRINLEPATRLAAAQRLSEIFPDMKEVGYTGDRGYIRLTMEELLTIVTKIMEPFSKDDVPLEEKPAVVQAAMQVSQSAEPVPVVDDSPTEIEIAEPTGAQQRLEDIIATLTPEVIAALPPEVVSRIKVQEVPSA